MDLSPSAWGPRALQSWSAVGATVSMARPALGEGHVCRAPGHHPPLCVSLLEPCSMASM